MTIQLYSTTWPTSASCNYHPAVSYDSTDTSYLQWSSSCAHLRFDHTSYQHHPSSSRHKYYYHKLYICACKHDNKLLYLLPCLCFLHCLWLSLLARFNLNHLWGRHAYWLRNNWIFIFLFNYIKKISKLYLFYFHYFFWWLEYKDLKHHVFIFLVIIH